MYLFVLFCNCGTQTWRLHPSFPQLHVTQFKPSNQSRTAYPDDILPPLHSLPNPSHNGCKLCYWLREQWLTAVEQGRDCFRLSHDSHLLAICSRGVRAGLRLGWMLSLFGLKKFCFYLCEVMYVCLKVALFWEDTGLFIAVSDFGVSEKK